MKLAESILRPVKKIYGGAKLPHRKNTAECEAVVMPPSGTVCIPMSQHIGAPCEPTVKKGDSVFVGTEIGKTTAFVSAPIHSSVSGTVKEVADKQIGGATVKCVVIESDGNMTPDPELKPHPVKTLAEVAEAAKGCGLVGLGGAGFPVHVKLSPSKDAEIDTLVINGAECEPYITADYRECMECYDDIIEGVYLLKEVLGVKKAVIGIENNKPLAIEKLTQLAADKRDADDSVKVMKLPSTYPQGAEKVIIYSATGRKLPLGKLPSDVGCIVMNITSIGVLYRYIKTGMPLVSKRITVDGDAVSEPKNVIVPIGTSVADVLEFVGGISESADKVIMGGPMMGKAISSDSDVIDKRTNALLIMMPQPPVNTTPCIRCGRCVAACPMNLTPAAVESAVNNGLTDRYKGLNVEYCMECGSCAFVCPAKRPLTQVMRVAKAELRRQKK